MRRCYDELVSKEKSLSSEVGEGDACALLRDCSRPAYGIGPLIRE